MVVALLLNPAAAAAAAAADNAVSHQISFTAFPLLGAG